MAIARARLAARSIARTSSGVGKRKPSLMALSYFIGSVRQTIYANVIAISMPRLTISANSRPTPRRDRDNGRQKRRQIATPAAADLVIA